MDKNKPIEIIVHHTGGTDENPLADSSNQTFADVNNWHRQNPNVWLGYYSSLGYAIGYHYFIDKQGLTTQGRANTDEGAHCKGQNRASIGICLAGNFDVTLPTPEQIIALTALLRRKMAELNIGTDKVYPHRHFAVKTCYGRLLSDTWVTDILKPVTITACQAERDEIVALKERVSWYDKLLTSIFHS